MIFQVRKLAEVVVLQDFVRHLIQRKRHLLIFIIGEEIARAQGVAVLGGYHPPHHLHGRVLAAPVTLALGHHTHLLHIRVFLLEADIQPLRTLHLHGTCVISHHREDQCAIAERYPVATVHVRCHRLGTLVSVIDMRHGKRLACSRIGHSALHNLCNRPARKQETEQREQEKSVPQHLPQ